MDIFNKTAGCKQKVLGEEQKSFEGVDLFGEDDE